MGDLTTELPRNVGRFSLVIKKPGELVMDLASGVNSRVNHGEVITADNGKTITYYMTQKTYDKMKAVSGDETKEVKFC